MSRADRTIDVRHLGRPGAVACRLLETGAGPLLVDPGPASTLETLEAALADAGVALRDLRALLLTHIHFDHAGAAGSLAQGIPGLVVHVHRAGAPHLADPSRLVASATRIYGDAMDRLWGPVVAVPGDRLRVLADGERLVVGDRAFSVRETPGHAVHHVAYLDEETGTAYVGDTAGVRPEGLPVAIPVTPPPDFDLETWLASLDVIAAWNPRRLFLTHFGMVDDPATHLADLRDGLVAWTAQVRALLGDAALSEAERTERFRAWVIERLIDRIPPEYRQAAAAFADFRADFHGIARYWSRRP